MMSLIFWIRLMIDWFNWFKTKADRAIDNFLETMVYKMSKRSTWGIVLLTGITSWIVIIWALSKLLSST